MFRRLHDQEAACAQCRRQYPRETEMPRRQVRLITGCQKPSSTGPMVVAHRRRPNSVSRTVAASIAELRIGGHAAVLPPRGCRTGGSGVRHRGPGRSRPARGRSAGLAVDAPVPRGSGCPGLVAGRTGPVALIAAAGSIPVRYGWRTDAHRWPVGRSGSPRRTRPRPASQWSRVVPVRPSHGCTRPRPFAEVVQYQPLPALVQGQYRSPSTITPTRPERNSFVSADGSVALSVRQARRVLGRRWSDGSSESGGGGGDLVAGGLSSATATSMR
jgi:hypothetical protein